MDHQKVGAKIVRLRRYGRVHVQTCARARALAVEVQIRQLFADISGPVDGTLEHLMRGLRPVAPDAARAILTFLLYRDMAYDVEIMPEQDAAALAEELFAGFAPDVSCLTNAAWDRDRRHGELCLSNWQPYTAATFDAGVVLHDAHSVAVVWFEDED